MTRVGIKREHGWKASPSFFWVNFLQFRILQKLYELDKIYKVTEIIGEDTYKGIKRRLAASEFPAIISVYWTRCLGGHWCRQDGRNREIGVTNIWIVSWFFSEEVYSDDQWWSFRHISRVSCVENAEPPPKGRYSSLAEVGCMVDVRLVQEVSLRRRETNVIISSIERIFVRLAAVQKWTDVVFCDGGYSAYSVMKSLMKKSVYVFGTVRDFEARKMLMDPFCSTTTTTVRLPSSNMSWKKLLRGQWFNKSKWFLYKWSRLSAAILVPCWIWGTRHPKEKWWAGIHMCNSFLLRQAGGESRLIGCKRRAIFVL